VEPVSIRHSGLKEEVSYKSIKEDPDGRGGREVQYKVPGLDFESINKHIERIAVIP